MKLVQPLLLAPLLILASHAADPSKLRNAKTAQRKPLDLDLVVKSVANYLWADSKNAPKQNFVIMGSYPAAVKAYEEKGLVLPFNDIDVFYASNDCVQDWKISYESGVVPGSDIEVNLVEMCHFDEDLEAHISVDINAVAVAVKVIPSTSIAGEVTPVIDAWAVSPHFEDFLTSEVLAITPSGLSKKPGTALVRLMAKAQQLRMPYVLPANQTLLEESFHGAPISDHYKTRLDALDNKHRSQFYEAFEIRDTNKPGWYRLALKDRVFPKNMRELQSSPYSDSPSSAPSAAPNAAPVPSPRPPPSSDDGQTGGGCFSSATQTHVKGKGLVSMMDLHIGDEVLTGNGSYEPVYAFAHYAPRTRASYLQLTTSGGTKLEVTPEHLIFIKDKKHPVRADKIMIGDSFQGILGDQDMSVTNIRIVELSGLFAPLTVDGTIVVEGIKASCYIWTGATPVDQHKLTHMTLSPFRWLCSGASYDFCHSYTEKGMPHFVDYGLQLATWFDTFHANNLIKAVMLMAYLAIVGIMRLIECIFCGYGIFWLSAAAVSVAVTRMISKSGIVFYAHKTKQI